MLKGAAPYSSGSRSNSVYNSGTWKVEAKSENKAFINNEKTTSEINDTGSSVSYHFTVKGFDFDDFTFPSQSAGNAGDVDWLSLNYIGSFSSWQIQVLQKYPETATADASPEITVKVDNLKAESLSGKNINTEAEAINTIIGGTIDNQCKDNVAIYTPGGISKHNSFGSRTDSKGSEIHGSISIGFLGTDYWNSPHYDANTFAGSDIYLWGCSQLGRNSDAVISAYNLLQKFDSKVLSIDQTVGNPVRYTDGNNDSAWPAVGWPTNKDGALLEAAGKHTILYAADPLNPGGWDSNDPDQMKRMNEATEEDLIYFKSLVELKNAGYTCIAVLLEVRDARIPAGCYPGIRVAMKVSDDTENINKTICTVNTARMWVKGVNSENNVLSSVSWSDGSKNNLTLEDAKNLNGEFKNVIEKAGKDIYSNYWKNSNSSVNNLLQMELNDTTINYLTAGYNNTDYHKTEYENGVKKDNTHEGYQQGMSLLVIGYESSIGIKVENTKKGTSSENVTGNVTFETAYSQWNPLYTIQGIKTTSSDPTGVTTTDTPTNLTVTATMLNAKGTDQIKMGATSFKVEDAIQGWIEISEKEATPTTVNYYDKDKKLQTYQIWAERSGDYKVIFHLNGVLVNCSLPDIQFEGQLGLDIEHNKSYTTQVTIQGDGDSRALSTNNSNIASVSITTIILEGTSLTKKVDKTLIEQNGEFQYSVNYTNTSNDEMSNKLYLYDLMPYNGDIRGTNYRRDEYITEESENLTVQKIHGSVSEQSQNTVAYIYYSTITQSVLKNYVEFANAQEGQEEPRNDGKDIDQLLRNALIGDDARGVYYIVNKNDFNEAKANKTLDQIKPVDIYTYSSSNSNQVTGVNTAIVEYDTSEPLGTVKIKEDMQDKYAFWNVRTGELVQSGDMVKGSTGSPYEDIEGELTLYKMFRWLGYIHPSQTGSDTIQSGTNVGGTGVQNQLQYATCLYATVEKLGPKTTLTLEASLATKNNEASNVYGNVAHSWKEGTLRKGDNLQSNVVSTRVVGREISGVVWVDVEKTGTIGVRDDNERLLSGVKCTLFKWNETSQMYQIVKCNEGPNGRLITAKGQNFSFENDEVQMVTGEDGSYSFENLASGDYVVALSEIENYYEATQYQVNGTNDDNTNDGVVNGSMYKGIDDSYQYCIQYSTETQKVHAHTLTEMQADTSLLTNGVETIEYQDLGLITHELPETGGHGTRLYKIVGLMLITVCLPAIIVINKKRKEEQEN